MKRQTQTDLYLLTLPQRKGAESLCHSYHHLYGIDVTIFRFFTVYGPAGRPDMSAFRFVQWISEGKPVIVYGDGKQSSRDYTYLEDIARGVIAGLETARTTKSLISVQTVPSSLLIRFGLIEELVGKESRSSRTNLFIRLMFAPHGQISAMRKNF